MLLSPLKKIINQTYIQLFNYITKILYCQEYSNECESNANSTIYIVVGGDHGIEKFRLVYKFILRDMKAMKIYSYVIKNALIDIVKMIYMRFWMIQLLNL